MGFFNYGSRNGIAEVIRLSKLVCRIYVRHATALQTYINGTSLTSEQKAIVNNWLSTAVDVCTLLETSVEVVYES